MIPTIPTITLLAIHGNGGGGFRFDRIRPYMPPSIKLVTPTLPGFADKPADPSLQTLADYAHHLHGLVRQEASPVVLLGTGIGGAFILEYLQHHAGSIAGVILHAPVGARLDTRRFPALMQLPGTRAFGKWLFSTPLTRPLFKRLLFMDYRQVPAPYLRRFFAEYRQCSVFAQMFDIITAQWFAELQPVQISSVLLWGAEERVLSPDHIEDYQRLLPDNTVRLVPGWDHFPMIEQPEAYAREVSDLSRALINQPQRIKAAPQ